MARDPRKEILNRGRRSIQVDLKHPDAAEFVLALVEKADVLFEGNRPGVTERLGVGPEACLARNPALVYGRMTGWGQTGPLAARAGHDINYIGVSGTLAMVGRAGEGPVPPANLLGDFGGGLLLALGIVSAVLHAKVTGVGQVVDGNIVDGTASFLAMHLGFLQTGLTSDERGTNSYDGGAHYYDAYETKDGRYMAAGSAEPGFYAAFLKGTGLDPEKYADQPNGERWPEWKTGVAAVFKTKTQAEWCAIFDGVDACVTPVYSPLEAPEAPHNKERGTFVTVNGVLQPGAVPRFSATPGAVRGIGIPGEGGDEALDEWGIGAAAVQTAREQGLLL